MKITIKTTQQKVYQVEVEETENIGALKAKIQESHGHSVSSQKIIYAGKILSDDKVIAACGIKEKDFLVLMVSKPKPLAAVASTPQPSTSAAVPEPVAAPAPVAETPAPPAPAPAPPAAVQEPTGPAGSSGSFLSGAALQSAINNLCEMGFERDQVQRAMRASFNNPDRAAEYLMTGIPNHLEEEAAGPAQAHPAGGAAPAGQQAAAVAPPPGNQPQNLFQLAQQHQQASGGATAGSGALPPGLNIEAIRNSPQIQQLRQQLAQNPEAAQTLLQQLAEQNPGVAQMIAQNPDMLYDLLGVDADGNDGIPPGAHVVNVTPEEHAAIERLEALGFSRQQALEAFLACDKNEELAANYLFESGFEDS